ncbi:Fe(3+)-siderophore ABC transporter permease [Dickeya parazeae]|nr:Fe(3+)-siderophore ABC transporter permease [Dickeya parazeae]
MHYLIKQFLSMRSSLCSQATVLPYTLSSLTGRRLGGVLPCLLLLALVCLASLMLGARAIAPEVVWQSLAGHTQGPDSIIVLQARLPRTLAGILVGMALGASGAVMQALTRNPLADPGILGVNAGASFAIVLGISVFGITGMASWLGFAWLGVLAASLMVWIIGTLSGGRVNPIRLTLAGVALSAVLSGFTSSLSLLNPHAFDQLRLWEAGTLDIRSLSNIAWVTPIVLLGCALAFLAARSLNTLSMGDDLATALGTRVGVIRVMAMLSVMLLCGSATALTGPIGFVGLMIPHIARGWAGPDQRWILLYSLLFAPILLLCADIVGRLLVAGELRVSIVTAFIGAPVLIWLVRQRKF